MIKTMQVIGSKKEGGAETFYLRFVEALREECDVLPVVRQGSWLAEQLAAKNIPHESASFGGAFDFFTKKRLAQLAKEYHPDVIQGWMNRASRFMQPVNGATLVGRQGGYYDLKYYRQMDYIIGNTEDICTHVKAKGWPGDKTRYLPNFALQPVPDFRQQREEVRRKYGIPAQAKVLLAAGRLHSNKAFDVLLDGLAALPADVFLLLAGEGKLEKDLRQQARDLKIEHRVIFTGWLAELSPLCAAADIWVVPSRHEPLGNVVLDAWMHHLPVVATKSAGPDVLIDDGKNGLLVPIDDEQAFAAAISKVLVDDSLAQALAEAGHIYVQEHFSAKTVVSRYLDFYQQITGK